MKEKHLNKVRFLCGGKDLEISIPSLNACLSQKQKIYCTLKLLSAYLKDDERKIKREDKCGCLQSE